MPRRVASGLPSRSHSRAVLSVDPSGYEVPHWLSLEGRCERPAVAVPQSRRGIPARCQDASAVGKKRRTQDFGGTVKGSDCLAVAVRWLVRQVERQRIANASAIHDEQNSCRSQRSRDDASRQGSSCFCFASSASAQRI